MKTQSKITRSVDGGNDAHLDIANNKRVHKFEALPPAAQDPLNSNLNINFPNQPEGHGAEAYGKMRMPELFRTIYLNRLERVIAKLAMGGEVSEKDEEFLNTLLEFCTENLERKTPIYGAWQGKIMMAADFDAPVEGFEEYFA
jgi:hypothetical protein